jgi:hypothetical protein
VVAVVSAFLSRFHISIAHKYLLDNKDIWNGIFPKLHGDTDKIWEEVNSGMISNTTL